MSTTERDPRQFDADSDRSLMKPGEGFPPPGATILRCEWDGEWDDKGSGVICRIHHGGRQTKEQTSCAYAPDPIKSSVWIHNRSAERLYVEMRYSPRGAADWIWLGPGAAFRANVDDFSKALFREGPDLSLVFFSVVRRGRIVIPPVPASERKMEKRFFTLTRLVDPDPEIDRPPVTSFRFHVKGTKHFWLEKRTNEVGLAGTWQIFPPTKQPLSPGQSVGGTVHAQSLAEFLFREGTDLASVCIHAGSEREKSVFTEGRLASEFEHETIELAFHRFLDLDTPSLPS